MGMLWFDGADYYTSSSAFPYDANNGVSIGTSFARTGLNGFQFTNAQWIRKSFSTNYTSLVAGTAIKPTNMTAGSAGALAFADNGTGQVGVTIDSLGRAVIVNGNTGAALATSSVHAMVLNQFHYLELEVASFGTSGVTNVYADGSLILSFTGKNFQSANQYANQLYIGQFSNNSSGMTLDHDDIYALDESGPAPWNAPLGDSFVVARMPSASGSFAQWTPNPAGVNLNWQRVDEIPPDGISTYNQAAASGIRDSFIYPTWPPAGITLPNIASIMAVMELEYGETDSAGTATVQLIQRQAGTDDLSATAIALGVGFAYGFSIFQKDVNGNLWLPTNLNATEYGYKRIA